MGGPRHDSTADGLRYSEICIRHPHREQVFTAKIALPPIPFDRCGPYAGDYGLKIDFHVIFSHKVTSIFVCWNLRRVSRKVKGVSSGPSIRRKFAPSTEVVSK